MYDLTTSRGRSRMLSDIEPNWQRLGSDIERQVTPVWNGIERQVTPMWRTVQGLDRPTWARIGGGMLALFLIGGGTLVGLRYLVG